jgi:hypothetical protein
MNKHIKSYILIIIFSLSGFHLFSQQHIKIKIDMNANYENKIEIAKIALGFNKEENCYITVTDSTLEIENHLVRKGNILYIKIEEYIISLNVDTIDMTIDISKSINIEESIISCQIRCTYSKSLEEWNFDCPQTMAASRNKACHYSLSCYETGHGLMPESWNPFKYE